MDKEKSDRTEEPGGGEKIPATDATSGGETLDDASGNKPFRPGQPEKYPPEKSNDSRDFADNPDAPWPVRRGGCRGPHSPTT